MVPVNSCGHVETMLVCGSGQQMWSCRDDAGEDITGYFTLIVFFAFRCVPC